MPACAVKRLSPSHITEYRALMALFGEAFEMKEVYTGIPPSEAYVRDLLASAPFIALTAHAPDGAAVIGGLTAYELQKFEQERSEVYIYDLAVAPTHRRQGVATALIEALKPIAAARGAYVIVVQADHDDPPAAALYGRLGVREQVLHFDIAVPPATAQPPSQ